MKLIYKISIIGIILLGVAHCAISFKNYKTLDPEAFWFFSAGLCLIFNGLINLLNIKINNKFTFKITLIANTLLTGFAIILAIKIQVFTMILVAIFSILLLASSFFLSESTDR